MIVTLSKPMFVMPPPRPTPSIVCPFRSSVMLPVPMTRALSGHSSRSFITLTLSSSTSPQTTSRATGAGRTRQMWVAVASPAPLDARTVNVWLPTASGPGYSFGERAGRERGGVELALERRACRRRGELERRARLDGRRVRCRGDAHGRRCQLGRIDPPLVCRRTSGRCSRPRPRRGPRTCGCRPADRGPRGTSTGPTPPRRACIGT